MCWEVKLSLTVTPEDGTGGCGPDFFFFVWPSSEDGSLLSCHGDVLPSQDLRVF